MLILVNTFRSDHFDSNLKRLHFEKGDHPRLITIKALIEPVHVTEYARLKKMDYIRKINIWVLQRNS